MRKRSAVLSPRPGAVLQDDYPLGKGTSHGANTNSGNPIAQRSERVDGCPESPSALFRSERMNESVAIASSAFGEAHAGEMEVEMGDPVAAIAPEEARGGDQPPPAAPGVPGVVHPIEEPSYVYTPDGIFFVPHWYIERDKNLPVMVKASMWKEMQEHHGRFTAVNFLCSTTVRAENIVVMTLVDPENPHGRYKRCHWFVRIAVQGGSKMFKEPFGANFLWQLPYGTCTKVVQEIKAYEVTNKVPETQGSSLVRALRPTAQDMHYKDWRDLQPVKELDGYYDKLFAMSVKPVRRTVALPKDNPMPELDRIVRPATVQALHRGKLDFSRFPDDVGGLIFETAATRWLNSHDASDWQAALALRRVCKGAKTIVDDCAEGVLKEMLSGIKKALVSGSVCDITKARDRILNTGLTTLSFVLDTNNPKFVNLARLRTNRKPGALPPPMPTPEERAAALKRVNDANARDVDMDDPVEEKTADKTPQRIRFEKDNAFIRRQLKRQRILMERNRSEWTTAG